MRCINLRISLLAFDRWPGTKKVKGKKRSLQRITWPRPPTGLCLDTRNMALIPLKRAGIARTRKRISVAAR